MLTDDDIQNILVASEKAFRNRKRPVNDLQPAYATKLKRLADQQLNDWCLHGVPARYWQYVNTTCSSIVTKFNLVQSDQLKTYKTAISEEHETDGNLQSTPEVAYNEELEENRLQENVSNFDSQSLNSQNMTDSSKKPENNDLWIDKLSLPRLLQHFAVYTNQKQDAITYLLMLLKSHQPAPCYSFLPSTGKKLLKIDGSDWQPTKKTESSKLLPSEVPLSGGKYFLFGLETALDGESPGVIYRDADLLQFVDIYLDEPMMLPKPLRKRIEGFDKNLKVSEAKRNLIKRKTTQIPSSSSENFFPHFEVDIFIDEVKPFRATDATSIIPILGRIHSLRPKEDIVEIEDIRVLKDTAPFIIGFYSGKGKPKDIESFLKPLIDEVIYLSPKSTDGLNSNSKLSFTASLRCVIADSPMRSYLKRTKGHSGYWSCDRCIQKGVIVAGAMCLKIVNAPLRTIVDFLNYFLNL